jgi:predicted  nucleic acid-binding Zn-ribbon protein
MSEEKDAGIRMISGAFGSLGGYFYTQPVHQFCPNCRCDVTDYMKYVGTTTVTATSGRGSRQERESYHKLYGDMLYEVPYYTNGKEANDEIKRLAEVRDGHEKQLKAYADCDTEVRKRLSQAEAENVEAKDELVLHLDDLKENLEGLNLLQLITKALNGIFWRDKEIVEFKARLSQAEADKETIKGNAMNLWDAKDRLEKRLSQAEAEIESRKRLSGELHKYHPDILALENRLSHLMDVAGHLKSALEGMMKAEKQLADSGDAGFWNAEEQEEYIQAKLALAEWDGIKEKP